MSDLFLFVDESGDFTFNQQASKYLVFSCLSTTQPDAIAHPLTKLRYDLFPQGFQLERFHAAEDKQRVRDQVFPLLAASTVYEVDAVVVEKRKTSPSLQSYRLYPRIYEILLRYVLNRQNFAQLNSLHVICDTVPLRKKQKAMEGALKMEVAALMHGRQIPHNVVFQPSGSHPFLQAVGYLGWAIFRRWERGDASSHRLIQPRIKSEFNVFAIGRTYYY
jgi:hypothetical protein